MEWDGMGWDCAFACRSSLLAFGFSSSGWDLVLLTMGFGFHGNPLAASHAQRHSLGYMVLPEIWLLRRSILFP